MYLTSFSVKFVPWPHPTVYSYNFALTNLRCFIDSFRLYFPELDPDPFSVLALVNIKPLFLFYREILIYKYNKYTSYGCVSVLSSTYVFVPLVLLKIRFFFFLNSDKKKYVTGKYWIKIERENQDIATKIA